jgi:hypothetical protein
MDWISGVQFLTEAKILFFSNMARVVLGPIQPPLKWYQRLSPWE